jgi:hypothetical protein
MSRWLVTILVTAAIGVAGVAATLIAAGRLPCPVVCSSNQPSSPVATQPSTVDIDPAVRLEPASGNAGTAVQLSVTHFGVDEPLDITLEDNAIRTAGTDGHGTCRVTVIIPASYASGQSRTLTIRVTGRTSRIVATATFELTVG